jgi:hypothetical protein
MSPTLNLDLVAIVHAMPLQRKTGKWSDRGMRLLLAETARCHHEAGEGFVAGMCCGVITGTGTGLALGTAFSRLLTTQPFLLSSSLVSSLE